MKQKAKNIFAAFMTGFIVSTLVMFVLLFLAPVLGLNFTIGWKSTFEIHNVMGSIYMSWFAPLLIGVVFAVVQFFDDFESHIKKHSHRLITTRDTRELIVIFWHGLWGLTLGFALTMLLMTFMAGTTASYSIPFLLEAVAKNGQVTGKSSIMTVFTILGLIWGLWKGEHLPKIKTRSVDKSTPRGKPTKKKAVKKAKKKKPVKKVVKKKTSKKRVVKKSRKRN